MTTPAFPRTLLAALVALLLVASACGGDADDGAEPAPTTKTAAAPDTTTAAADDAPTGILDPGPATHLGASWFSPPPPESSAVIGDHWDDVTAASSVARFMIDWVDVEPDRGDVRVDEIEEWLASTTDQGLQPMVSIVALDLSGTDVPDWLGGFDPEPAAAAYLAMAEQVVPILERHDVWLFAIANEPPLGDYDGDELADFATFAELVMAGMDELAPDLATTFTFAGGDPFIDDPAIERMVDAVDVLSVNHYCLDATLQVTGLDDIAGPIDRIVARAGSLPVVFQEFGCPAATSMGSSDEYQLAWFDAALAHIAASEQVRAAFVFEFLDWSPETFALDYGSVVDVLIEEVGEAFTTRFEDWVLTSGLVRIDGTTRPAFDLYLEAAPAMASAG